jgi:rhodanese-related sulfurtransferase
LASIEEIVFPGANNERLKLRALPIIIVTAIVSPIALPKPNITPPAIAEIAAGKIPGAIELDFYGSDFVQRILQLDKTKAYFMVCRSGGRSGQACSFMSQNGFNEIYNLAGGMIAWDVEIGRQ